MDIAIHSTGAIFETTDRGINVHLPNGVTAKVQRRQTPGGGNTWRQYNSNTRAYWAVNTLGDLELYAKAEAADNLKPHSYRSSDDEMVVVTQKDVERKQRSTWLRLLQQTGKELLQALAIIMQAPGLHVYLDIKVKYDRNGGCSCGCSPAHVLTAVVRLDGTPCDIFFERTKNASAE
jgi:hypothetical protein